MISRENINSTQASLIVEELVRHGIELFCISPGSRSTPLTVAAARHPKTQCQICHDERGAAFLALGYGKATGRPAALICTSGTAAGNYLPAIIEAAMDDTPLIALTADRPPELLDAGANQTIFQDHIYGDYVRWQKTLPPPSEEISPRFVLTTVDQAVHRALVDPGPVHINCQFREPLEPTEIKFTRHPDQRLTAWEESGNPFSSYASSTTICSQQDLQRITDLIHGTQKGLVILGRLAPHQQHSPAISDLLDKLTWPVHADIGSGFRLAVPQWPVFDELTMQTSRWFKEAPPNTVLHLGGPFISKRLQSLLQKSPPAQYIHVHENSRRIDPGHIVSHRLACDVDEFCAALTARLALATPFSGKDTAAHEAIDAHFLGTGLSEPLIARLISRHLPQGHALFLSNSQPVRDMNEFAALDGPASIVGTNRGASGIDGIVASAVGFARGLEKPTTLIIGDTALLHDLNSLHLAANSPQPLTIICINNNGGGIFNRLPISEFKDVFEPFFVAPHNRNFQSAAAMFDLPWTNPASQQELLETLQGAWRSGRSSIIEVTISQQDETRQRKELSKLLRRQA